MSGIVTPIGPAVVNVLGLAYTANVPAILIGTHGVGKSEIVATAAKILGIDCIARDLSLMEPPDLAGLPQLDGGATTFVPPDFLPRETGRGGILLIEEINRAPRYMQTCCLELLTSRRLNSYRLPDGWLPVACINPKSAGYQVDLLDPALMSRFMKIEVCPALSSWLEWARENGVHPKVIEYVQGIPNALDESQGGVNPRSWAYASRTLLGAGKEALELSTDTIVAALNGLIGPVHTTGLLRLVSGTEVPLSLPDVIRDWPGSRAAIRRWARQGRLDLLASSMRAILRWIRPESVATRVAADPDQSEILRGFFSELPGDLADEAKACLIERGYTFFLSGASSSGATK